ncbi:MAG: YqgE/AlgH family protein [Duncaniella sp.]|nr:YqgE/AlgH family protein [Duncaniella sp.]MDE5734621.1 YqgE/AlgH family protein [Duncaniella sp.]MDE6178060.1 YqgE/AlgH family protein [Duncaniella sp.]
MNNNSLLFNIDLYTGEDPAVGKLLVAEPFLREDHFNHAVISIIDYEPGTEAMGVVLNNPSATMLHELIDNEGLPEDIRVYHGGPVGSDRLYFMHTLGDIIPETRPVGPDLWLGGDFDAVFQLIRDGYNPEGQVRFFLGYSGWEPGQLEEELGRNVWAVSPPHDGTRLLEGDGSRLWHDTVRALGPGFRGWLYHPRNLMAN